VQYDAYTPLICACKEGHTDVAQLLLSHSADVEAFSCRVCTQTATCIDLHFVVFVCTSEQYGSTATAALW